MNRERAYSDNFHREKQLYRRTYVRSIDIYRERERENEKIIREKEKNIILIIINYLLV
jgi:hypothetical protein